MALSFASVEEAYKVFHELGVKNVPSWPEDMAEWDSSKKKDPKPDTVYGWSKKYDNGWENLFFFIKNPTEEFKQKFDNLKRRVPNSSISKPYDNNPELWIFGWF